MNTKTCTRCGETKPLSEYLTYHGKTEAACKTCKYAYAKQWRDSHREYRNAESREYYAKNRVAIKKKQSDKRISNPNQTLAKRAVDLAQRKGAPKPNQFLCASCGEIAEEFHHWSYEEQHRLSVVPVCRRCHRSHHFTEPNTAFGQNRAVDLSKEPQYHEP